MPQRTVNETFSEEEFARLQEVKGDRTWREFIIYAATGSPSRTRPRRKSG